MDLIYTDWEHKSEENTEIKIEKIMQKTDILG